MSDNTERYVSKDNSLVSTTAVLTSEDVEKYKQGQSLANIGKQKKLSKTKVKTFLVAHGVQIRESGGSCRKKDIPEEVLREILKEHSHTKAAEILQVSRATVTRHASRLGLYEYKPKNKERLEKDSLYEHYVVLDKTAAQIGREIGVPYDTVTTALKRHNIPIRNKQAKNIDEQEVVKKYVELKERTIDIAKEYGVTQVTIRRILKKQGVQIVFKPPVLKETRIKQSAVKQGVSVSEWEGFITDPKIRMTWQYNEWRKNVLERDKFVCQVCGKKGKGLQAHHKKTFAQYPELRYDVQNGITVCKTCHNEIHSMDRREWAKRSNKI